MLRKILSALSVLVMLGVFYLAVVVAGSENGVKREEPASLPSVGVVRSSSQADLAAVLGCPFPSTLADGAGEVKDARVGTLNARLLTWQSADGLVISAVRPAAAAALIRHDGLTLITDTRWELGPATVVIAVGEAGACAYYETDDAAYALFLSGADADALLLRLSDGVTLPGG
ncbi:MAG: hypothetical protein IJS53_05125 [Clostridia bacterium]|nr:hypothetical protein [Clostridia bacterium]